MSHKAQTEIVSIGVLLVFFLLLKNILHTTK